MIKKFLVRLGEKVPVGMVLVIIQEEGKPTTAKAAQFDDLLALVLDARQPQPD